MHDLQGLVASVCNLFYDKLAILYCLVIGKLASSPMGGNPIQVSTINIPQKLGLYHTTRSNVE